MANRFRIALFSGVALIATTPALAQQPAAAADGEIIVTARRREESLIDVPIAISAISGAQLESRGAIDITDIDPKEALVQYEMSLERSPDRLNSIYGAANAAEHTGDGEKAKHYYERVVYLTSGADASFAKRKKSMEYLSRL